MKPFESCHHEGLRIFLLYNMPRYWVVRVGYHRGMFWSNLEWLSHPLAPYSEYQYFDLILSHYLLECQEHSPMSIIHQKNSETFVMTWFERFHDPFNYKKVKGGLTSDTNFWTPCISNFLDSQYWQPAFHVNCPTLFNDYIDTYDAI